MRSVEHADVRRVAERLAVRRPSDAVQSPESRLAAVAVVFRVLHEPEMLFIKRAELERDPWSGHIAFPGGRHEPTDHSLMATAVRETSEELALDLGHGHYIGRLDDLAPRSRSLPPVIVRPFVFVVDADAAHETSFVLSDEVASAFWVPVSVFLQESAQAEHVVSINGVRARFPAFRVNEHIVWGLTERIVRQLLSLLSTTSV